jgi:hypothetical protein
MVLVGSTLNRLFITSPILGRDELPLIRVCLPGAILRLGRPSVGVTYRQPRMSGSSILPAQARAARFKPQHWLTVRGTRGI